MKERRQKEEAHRSAVSGKKIKLKIKKSSKDKEVNLLYFFNKVFDLLGISIHILQLYTKGRRGGGGITRSPHEISVSPEALLSIVAILLLKRIKRRPFKCRFVISWKRAILDFVELFFCFLSFSVKRTAKNYFISWIRLYRTEFHWAFKFWGLNWNNSTAAILAKKGSSKCRMESLPWYLQETMSSRF